MKVLDEQEQVTHEYNYVIEHGLSKVTVTIEFKNHEFNHCHFTGVHSTYTSDDWAIMGEISLMIKQLKVKHKEMVQS